MAERPLSMREVLGSIPGFSRFLFGYHSSSYCYNIIIFNLGGKIFNISETEFLLNIFYSLVIHCVTDITVREILLSLLWR